LMFGYLRAGIGASVLFACLSIIGFFVAPGISEQNTNKYVIFASLWICLGALSLATFYRITQLLFKLLRHA
jgi:hypothetical protein